MPIKVPDNLPAKEILQNENIFVMGESRAFSQDIRPLKIAILNLMPNKQATEVQLMRLLGNTPLQLEIRLLHMESHESKNTPTEYLKEFYDVFDDVRNQRFDGMIITGAPIEQMPFEEVNYWTELCEIMEWSKTHVTSVFHICWGAQAGLYYHYGIEKYPLENKMFGVFQHYRLKKGRSILRGFDDVFYAPHSRHTEVRAADIERVANLEILASSDQAGVYLVASKDGRQLFVTGHSEYDRLTLHNEYMRDLAKGDAIELPRNYYRGDDPEDRPVMNWRAHSALLYGNWVNLVYQETPYNWIF